MQLMINLREINQNLSKYISSLKAGNDIVITKRGKPVAKLVAFTDAKPLDENQRQALARLRENLKNGFHLGGKGINRDPLHQR